MVCGFKKAVGNGVVECARKVENVGQYLSHILCSTHVLIDYNENGAG